MAADTSVTVAGLELKNPVIAGSGEATMTSAGLDAAIAAGAAAVVAKSTNESPAAKRQLETAEYALLDESWRRLPWGPAPRGASLFCRSGLVGEAFERWVEILAGADRSARARDAYVVPSLIVADLTEAVSMARQLEQAGLRWLEVNVGAPHAEEAEPGAITSERAPERVAGVMRRFREAVGLPMTLKLSGEEDPLPAVAAARDAGADAVCIAGRHLAFIPDPETRRPVLGTFAAIGGAWALPLTLRWIAKARLRFGADLSIVGTNGARNGLDVVRFLLAGARAVQMTSAVMTDGAEVLRLAVGEIERYLKEQGTTVRSIIGEATDNVMTYREASMQYGRRTQAEATSVERAT